MIAVAQINLLINSIEIVISNEKEEEEENVGIAALTANLSAKIAAAVKRRSRSFALF